MSKGLLGFLNGLITFVVAMSLLTAGAYAGYALWDNQQIYTAAEGVQAELLAFKPKEVVDEATGEVKLSFEDLLAINPDVCAWIAMDGTAIDHAVLQGVDNLTYINKDVYGSFALAGSIFLDSRCDRTFNQPYALLYGHHMVNHGMFGDLDLYKDKAFFEQNHTGTLLTPEASHPLHVMAVIVTQASDDAIFEPLTWEEDVTALVEYTRENALYLCEEFMAEAETALKDPESRSRILALSTCSSEYTNARTIIVTLMDPPQGELPETVTITQPPKAAAERAAAALNAALQTAEPTAEPARTAEPTEKPTAEPTAEPTRRPVQPIPGRSSRITLPDRR